MSNPSQITIVKFRQGLTEIVDEARFTGQPVEVTRNGRVIGRWCPERPHADRSDPDPESRAA